MNGATGSEYAKNAKQQAFEKGIAKRNFVLAKDMKK